MHGPAACLRTIALAAILGALGGCASLTERRDDAAEAAARFEQALRAGDLPAACAALAPATREELEQNAKAACADALPGQELPDAGAVRRTNVHGDQARAVFDGDTLFLARFPSGWRVTAAGCREQPGDRPYNCTVKGR
ncbi:hypothetical protein [Yinghuangia sp. YIM S09857]|uniref:hypothetical protein n=1 Tax=Yinghuangia sp. YIM S09857 TaxID=3436929 RepID=UPI003F53E3C5